MGRKFRPSNSDRYINCPASVVAAADMPVDSGSKYASEGTAVHAIIENCIDTGNDPSYYLGKIIVDEYNVPTTQEMVISASKCMSWIKSMHFSTVQSEAEVCMPWIKNPDGEKTTGKVDIVGYDTSFDLLSVADYKNGYLVVPNDSYQFACYAYPLLFAEDSIYKHVDEVKAIRIQPNAKGGDVYGEHIWTRAELTKLKDKIDSTLKWVSATKYEELKATDYCEGHWCKFCPLKDAGAKMCPLKVKSLFDSDVKTKVIEVVSNKLPAPASISDAQIAELISKRKDIKKWLDNLYRYKLNQASEGVKLEGLKLIAGKAKPREWRKDLDEATLIGGLIEAGGLMRDECHTAKLQTPAMVKKILKGSLNTVEEYLEPAEHSVELVPREDKRISKNTADLFQ